MTVYRHLLMGLLVLALTAGTGWQSCAKLQHQPSSPVAPVDRMASHEGHQHHRLAIADNHDDNDAVSVAHKDQPTRDAHGCPKCCGICMLASVIPEAPDWTLAAMISRRFLVLPGVPLRGHIVFVDPEIPK